MVVAAGGDAPAPLPPPAASLSARRQRRPSYSAAGRNGAERGRPRAMQVRRARVPAAAVPPATPPPAGNVTGSAAPSGAPRRSKPAPGVCRAAEEGGYSGTQSWLQGGTVTGTRDWVSRTQPHDWQQDRARSARRRQQLACSEPVALDATAVPLGHPRDPLPSPSSWHRAGICPWLLPCSIHWWAVGTIMGAAVPATCRG